MTRPRRLAALALVAAVAGTTLTGCSASTVAVPRCTAGPRLAIVAQSVPGASYVPCINQLGEGWTAGAFDVGRGRTTFTLLPHRAASRAVEVTYRSQCRVEGAVATTPRADGVRTSINLVSVSPRYAGTISDVFTGGCVTYRFDFARGPHIALMEELATTVGLFSRRQLRLELHQQLHVDLDR